MMDSVYGDPDHSQGWRLVCVREGSSALQPIPIRANDLALVNFVARGLSLVVRQDDRGKKVYLTKSGVGIRYPSGFHAQEISDVRAGARYQAGDHAAPCIASWPDLQLSESFWISHFQAPGYALLRVSPVLVDALEAIKLRAGHPLEVLSGYRPPAHNRECGGVSDSLHVDGLAADLSCPGLDPWELYKICLDSKKATHVQPKAAHAHINGQNPQKTPFLSHLEPKAIDKVPSASPEEANSSKIPRIRVEKIAKFWLL